MVKKNSKSCEDSSSDGIYSDSEVYVDSSEQEEDDEDSTDLTCTNEVSEQDDIITLSFQVVTFNLQTLYTNTIRDKTIHLNTVYQRDVIWKTEEKENYINSCYLGKNPGPIIFNRKTNPIKKECIDGKQRLTSIIEFMQNKITVRLGKKRYFYSQIPDKFKNDHNYGVLSDNNRISNIDNRSIVVFEYTDLSYKDEVDIFGRIQYGKVLTTGEKFIAKIDNVDKAKIMSQLCDALKDKKLFRKFKKLQRGGHREYLSDVLYVIEKKSLMMNKNKKIKFIDNMDTVEMKDKFKLVEDCINGLFDDNVLNHTDIDIAKININLLIVLAYFVNNKAKFNKSALRSVIIKISNTDYGSSRSGKKMQELENLVKCEYNKKIKNMKKLAAKKTKTKKSKVE